MVVSRFEHRLRKLDDRMTELHRLDSAIKLGRLQGELFKMQQRNAFFDQSQPKPKYERTPESRLEKHYAREYERLLRGVIQP
jgi:hypothetical protein